LLNNTVVVVVFVCRTFARLSLADSSISRTGQKKRSFVCVRSERREIKRDKYSYNRLATEHLTESTELLLSAAMTAVQRLAVLIVVFVAIVYAERE